MKMRTRARGLVRDRKRATARLTHAIDHLRESSLDRSQGVPKSVDPGFGIDPLIDGWLVGAKQC